MTLNTFFFGLLGSFGFAWFFAIVLPFYKTTNPETVKYQEGLDEKTGIYFPKRTGQIANGALVYGENGCYVCHTQVVRPTYAGTDYFRDGVGGFAAHPDRGDTRRESNVFDYRSEAFAHIGTMRIGPDLSNVGNRFALRAIEEKTSPEKLLAEHLFNPRAILANRASTCTALPFFFEKKRNVAGELVAKPEARALISYLNSMKKDDVVPASMNYSPPKPAAE